MKADIPRETIEALLVRWDTEFTRIARLKRPDKEQFKMPMLTVFIWLEELRDVLDKR